MILETIPPTPESPAPVTYLTAGETMLTMPMSWIEKIVPVMPAVLRQHRLNPQEAVAVRGLFGA